MKTDHEWIVERHEAFVFRGPSGNPAIADVAIVTRDGSVPVVVATEREDNPGVSITNGAEQLAAEVLLRLFPERAGESQPFRLVEHYRAGSFDSTMNEVTFANFELSRNGNVPRIGDVIEWQALDVRVAAVLAAQANKIAFDEQCDRQHQEALKTTPEQWAEKQWGPREIRWEARLDPKTGNTRITPATTWDTDLDGRAIEKPKQSRGMRR
jgi:hypothetical protein